MAEPIRLGLVLEGEDAREFEERMRNPKVTTKQVEFFSEANRVYGMHHSDFSGEKKRTDTNLWFSFIFGGMIIMIGLLITGLLFMINGCYELGMVYLGVGVILGLVCGGYYSYLKLIDWKFKR